MPTKQTLIDFCLANPGKIIAGLSKEYQVSTGTVTTWLKTHGINKAFLRSVDPKFSKTTLVRMYTDGMSISEIAKKLAVPYGKMVARFKELDITLRDTVSKMPSKAVLTKLYVSAHMPIRSIGKQFGCSSKIVNRWLEHYGIKIVSGQFQQEHAIPPKAKLVQMHVVERKSAAKIAKHFGVSIVTSTRWLKELGVYTPLYNKKLTEDALRDLYQLDGATTDSVAKHVGCSQAIVSLWLQEYGIEAKPQPKMPVPSKKTLVGLYVDQQKTHAQIGELYNVSGTTVGEWMKTRGIDLRPGILTSSAEREIVEYIQSLGINDIVQSDRVVLSGKEIDILIPSKKVAIEFNGVYFHSSKYRPDAKYHQKKMQTITDAGFRSIMIWEDDWKNPGTNAIIKGRLSNALGVFKQKISASRCEVREITQEVANDFFSKTHIQGGAKSSIAFGLFHKDNLVCAMSLCKSRFNKTFEWEILRLSSAIGTTVHGAFTRLFNAFVLAKRPSLVVSYADLCWGTGNVYASVGFEKTHMTVPGFSFVKGGKRHNRMTLQKWKLLKDNKGLDETKTGIVLAKELGYHQLFDCGHNCWVWTCHDKINK